MKMIRLKKKLGGMVKSDEKNSQVSDLVDRCDDEAFISSPPSIFAILLDSIFRPPVAAFGANLITQLEDKSVKQLTQMMQSLVLFVHTIQMHLGQAQAGVSQLSLPNPSYQLANNHIQRLTSSSFPAGVNKFLYC